MSISACFTVLLVLVLVVHNATGLDSSIGVCNNLCYRTDSHDHFHHCLCSTKSGNASDVRLSSGSNNNAKEQSCLNATVTLDGKLMRGVMFTTIPHNPNNMKFCQYVDGYTVCSVIRDGSACVFTTHGVSGAKHSGKTDKPNPYMECADGLCKKGQNLSEAAIRNPGSLNCFCPKTSWRTPLMMAAIAGEAKKFKILIALGAQLAAKDSAGRGMLHVACKFKNGEADIVKTLVALGLNIESRDRMHSTPLLQAVLLGSGFDIVDYLVSIGGEVDDVDGKGNTLLHWAVTRGPEWFEHVIKMNIKTISMESRNNEGYTPPLFLVKVGPPKNLKYLHQMGYDLKGTDKTGNTILHLAVLSKSLEIVETVCSLHVVSFDKKNLIGDTALKLAERLKLSKIAEFLLAST